MFKEINKEKNLNLDVTKVVACGIEEKDGKFIIWFDGINGNTYHSAPFFHKDQAEQVLEKYCKN